MSIKDYAATLLIAVGILFAATACENEGPKEALVAATETKKEMEKQIELVGKSLEYNYGEDVYQLQFQSDTSLHWKCVQGDEAGKEADETYATQRLNKHSFFVSWVEADGLGVSQVINLKDMTINCYLKIDRDIIPLSGTIREF